MTKDIRAMRLRPIEHAPLDGTAILALCGKESRDYHLVSYVGGAWMDIHGGYILNEGETGLPTHFVPLPSDAREIRGGSRLNSSGRLACAMFLVTVAVSAVLGAAIGTHFDPLAD